MGGIGFANQIASYIFTHIKVTDIYLNNYSKYSTSMFSFSHCHISKIFCSIIIITILMKHTCISKTLYKLSHCTSFLANSNIYTIQLGL